MTISAASVAVEIAGDFHLREQPRRFRRPGQLRGGDLDAAARARRARRGARVAHLVVAAREAHGVDEHEPARDA